MAQLRDTLIQGSARVTDTLYATNINGGTITAPIYWEGSTALPEKTSADYFLAIDAFASGGKTYFVKAANVLSSIGAAASGHNHDDTYLQLDGGTVTGTLTLSKTQDASGTANNSPALIVGGTATSKHLEFDFNEIMAKTNGTSTADLYLNGDGSAVYFGPAAKAQSATSTVANTHAYADLTLGNTVNVTSTSSHSEGRIYIYSAATKAHIIVGESTTTDYTHTLPNNTGLLVSLSGSTAKGSTTKPVYIPATGIVTECNTYAGGTAVTLNGSSKASSTASFYSPTGGGTAGYILKAGGANTAPDWIQYVPVANGGTGAGTFTDECIIVGNGTNALESRGLKVTGATNADVTIQNNTSAKALNIESPGGKAAITINTAANGGNGALTLSSGNTLFINKPTGASIVFTNDGADTDHETGRFNSKGMLQLNSTVTQNTHKLLVNGDSGFTGKVAFTNSAATLTEYAYIEYDNTLHTLNFSVT